MLAAVVLLVSAVAASAAEVETLPFEARAADGVALRGHVTLPKAASRPLATVLHFSPYFESPSGGNDFEGTATWAQTSPELSFLLDAGFAVATVSMRGTGQSEGCLRFGDEIDQADAGTVVQALAAQPWSNGKVGMYGHSYPAWTAFMAAAAGAPALKAIVPTSGVTDYWSLVTRRGAPLAAGQGTALPGVIVAGTGHLPPQGVFHLACPEIASAIVENAQVTVDGDRSDFFERRDLRERLTDSPVAIMASVGIVTGFNDGHIQQLDGMWDRLRPDRTRFVLGEWQHETPTLHRETWHEEVVGWFDHYLRGGPQVVKPGLVEYQDDIDERWHSAKRWPPPAEPQTLRLSATELVPAGEPVDKVDASFLSADVDPGLKAGEQDDSGRIYGSICGPHQVLFESAPLKADALLAGYASFDLELTSDQPGGNLSVFLWRTTGDGTCPDLSATFFNRALMDLRHFKEAGNSEDFPVGVPTRVSLEGQAMAANVKQGERIVVAIGGGSSELEPDLKHPRITITGGSVRLPVVTGEVAPYHPCHRTVRLPRRLARATARVNGRSSKVRRRAGRLTVRVRGVRGRVSRIEVRGVTRSGRPVVVTRRLAGCGPGGAR